MKPLSFFSSSHQALSSLIKLIIPPVSLISPHLSSSSHLPSTPKPKPSPSLSSAPVVAVPRRQLLTLTSLPHRCRPTHALDPLRRSKPLTHLEVSAPTLPSQTHDKELLLLAAHAGPAHARRRCQPTSGQSSLFISS